MTLNEKLQAVEGELRQLYKGDDYELARKPFEVAAQGDLYALVQSTKRNVERQIGEFPPCINKYLDNIYQLGILEKGPGSAGCWKKRAKEFDEPVRTIYRERAKRIADEAGISYESLSP